MSCLAVHIQWDDSTGSPEIEGMLNAAAHRATDGYSIARIGACTMGYGKYATTARQTTDLQPLQDFCSTILAVGDIRLDNRRDLLSLFSVDSDSDPSDLMLVLLGYRRFGPMVAKYLEGDFAFVLWDMAASRVLAARDHFGVRPLFYHVTPGHLALASEVQQLLVLPNAQRRLVDSQVVDYFQSFYHNAKGTFFNDIFRVQPGHIFLATKTRTHEERYFFPPSSPIHLSIKRDYEEEFRRLMRKAVELRLDSHLPVVCHLSGGLDSSSIVCVADDIIKRGLYPPLSAVSATFPGLPCDDSFYIREVAKQVSVRCDVYDATNPNLIDEDFFEPAQPTKWTEQGLLAAFCAASKRASARVMLGGFGADELLFEVGVYRDLAVHGKWLSLLRESALAPRYSLKPAHRWLTGAFQPMFPPSIQSLWNRRPKRIPNWIAPNLRGLWNRPHESSEHFPWLSHLQERNWWCLTNPNEMNSLEMFDLWASRRGLRLRYPFLDIELARFVLAIPYEYRLPAGRMKALLRDSLRSLLPTVLCERRGVASIGSYVRNQCAQNTVPIKDTLCDRKPWLSEPYVDRVAAQALLNRLASLPLLSTNWIDWRILWDIAKLEQWLRIRTS